MTFATHVWMQQFASRLQEHLVAGRTAEASRMFAELLPGFDRPASLPVALLREMLAAKKRMHEESLRGWTETPRGYLVPTEPDDGERELVRERLKAAIDVVQGIDDYVCDCAGVPEGER